MKDVRHAKKEESKKQVSQNTKPKIVKKKNIKSTNIKSANDKLAPDKSANDNDDAKGEEAKHNDLKALETPSTKKSSARVKNFTTGQLITLKNAATRYSHDHADVETFKLSMSSIAAKPDKVVRAWWHKNIRAASYALELDANLNFMALGVHSQLVDDQHRPTT